MAAEVQATEVQQALFREWAGGTEFVLDIHNSPKRQFNILAKTHGWVGGEEVWNTNWLKCFDEEYIWRGDGIALDAATRSTTLTDTNSILHNTAATFAALSHTIWTKYDGFFPDATADFVKEFERLADHTGWNRKERKQYRPELLMAEFDNYYGKDDMFLPDWQNLCMVVGIEPIPASIEECAVALNNKLVNIVNVVNHCRTGDPIHTFPTKRHFIDYTWPNRTFPFRYAEADTLIARMLKPVGRENYNAAADKEYAAYLFGGCME